MANKLKLSVALTAVANTKAIRDFNKDLRATQYALRQLQPALAALKKGLLGLGGMGYAFYGLAQSAHKLGEVVTKLAQATGASTDDLQVLGRVAAQNGAKLEDMSKAVLALTKSTQAAALGNKGLAERFARLGIDLERFKALSPERQMERLGHAVNAAREPQAALAEVMGLIGADAAPKLMESLQALGAQGFDQLKEKAQAAGEVMSGQAIEALARADQNLSDLGHRFKMWAADWSEGAMLLYDAYVKSDKVLDAADKALALRRRFEGQTNYRVAAAAMDAAAAHLKEGTQAGARFFLKDASQWIEEARAGVADGSRKADAKLVARYDALNSQLEAKFAVAKAHQEALAQVAAESSAVQEVAVNAQIEQDLEAHDAAIAAIAKQRLEREAAAFGELQRQAQSAFAQIEQFEREALSPGELLRAQINGLRGQLEGLAAEGALGDEQWGRAREVLNEKFEESARLLAKEQEVTRFEALGEQSKALLGEFDRLDGVIENQLSGTLKSFVETGTADMKKLGQSILNEVIQSMLKALVLKPLLGGMGKLFGGAGGGGLFSGLGGAFGLPSIPGKASGGAVTGTRPYLVGERGPELFIPPVSGQIIDANKTAAVLAGDTATGAVTGSQNIYQIDARGADAGAVTRLEAALLKLAGPGVVEKRAHAASAERLRRG